MVGEDFGDTTICEACDANGAFVDGECGGSEFGIDVELRAEYFELSGGRVDEHGFAAWLGFDARGEIAVSET